ncbi:MAG: hypothetical protein AAGC60_21760 [Acidobacteriota bacterium]
MSETTPAEAKSSDRATAEGPRLAHRLRLSAVLIVIGLAVEIATLAWAHPTAFLAFAGIGGLLVAAGVALYLWTVLRFTSGAAVSS